MKISQSRKTINKINKLNNGTAFAKKSECRLVYSSALHSEEWKMSYGTVKWFNEKTGAGYIRTDRGEDVLFLNRTVRPSDLVSIHKGARVSLDVLKGQYGLTAVNVRSTELSEWQG